ncbi:MAG TPA: methionyl-tRNA formyltransferase, partial [Epsilonproteobacteria bacterium]|nr:methionyl-tRNA formyltransferase [Campylobacterota bacterium]
MRNKIVYMGTPHYAKEILEALVNAEDMNVSLVLTQPDRPVGRKKVLTPPPVKVLAEEHDIKVLQPSRLSEEGIFEAIEKEKPDFIIVAAFGQILPKNILDIAPCINLHASLLPQYRGASPVQQSLLNGDEKTGVTSMLMEEGLDTG